MYTPLYVHVCGHGLIGKDGKVYLLCDTTDKKKMLFPFERMLRTVTGAPGSYILAVLDICREPVPEVMLDKTRGEEGEMPQHA